jgi:hypothetical protein
VGRGTRVVPQREDQHCRHYQCHPHRHPVPKLSGALPGTSCTMHSLEGAVRICPDCAPKPRGTVSLSSHCCPRGRRSTTRGVKRPTLCAGLILDVEPRPAAAGGHGDARQRCHDPQGGAGPLVRGAPHGAEARPHGEPPASRPVMLPARGSRVVGLLHGAGARFHGGPLCSRSGHCSTITAPQLGRRGSVEQLPSLLPLVQHDASERRSLKGCFSGEVQRASARCLHRGQEALYLPHLGNTQLPQLQPSLCALHCRRCLKITPGQSTDPFILHCRRCCSLGRARIP